MLFFELIQVAVGKRTKLSVDPSEDEWVAMFEMAKKQSLVGVTFLALDKLLREGQKPPTGLLYEWIGCSEMIKQRNKLLNKKCLELIRFFSDAGFESCILKGQGNALMYPEPLLRTPGDIDIWVNGKRSELIDFCRLRVKDCKIVYHHLQFPVYKDIDVEVHFTPSFSRNPRYVEQTCRYFEKYSREEIDGVGLMLDGEKMYVPSKDMNLVFQMSHMARHFFYEGIGMRQLMDYYYLLKYTKGTVNKESVVETIRNLGVYKFSRAVMWVVDVVMEDGKGKGEDWMICEPDMKRGKLLLDEIMKSGNFGQYDHRISGKIRYKSTALSVVAKNMRLLLLFPEEAFWAPIMGGWHHLKYKNS